MMLKNAANSRKVDHDIQRKALKDATNSREVDLDLVHMTKMLKNTTNSRKVDHGFQRKVLKDGTTRRKVGHNPQRKVLTTTVGLKYITSGGSKFVTTEIITKDTWSTKW